MRLRKYRTNVHLEQAELSKLMNAIVYKKGIETKASFEAKPKMQEQSTSNSLTSTTFFSPKESDNKVRIYFCSVAFDWDAAPRGLSNEPPIDAPPLGANELPMLNVLGFAAKADCAPEVVVPKSDG